MTTKYSFFSLNPSNPEEQRLYHEYRLGKVKQYFETATKIFIPFFVLTFMANLLVIQG